MDHEYYCQDCQEFHDTGTSCPRGWDRAEAMADDDREDLQNDF
jgi:hypothetical protein